MDYVNTALVIADWTIVVLYAAGNAAIIYFGFFKFRPWVHAKVERWLERHDQARKL